MYEVENRISASGEAMLKGSDMKLLALVVLGILFAVTLSQANDEIDYVLTDEALLKLHVELNACDADAKQFGFPNYGRCSDVQHMLVSHYSSYDEYQQARKANQ